VGVDGTNGQSVEEQGSEEIYTVTMTYNPRTCQINVLGLNVPPWISLGMLRYMEILIRRRDAENAMLEAAANLPRIARPGGHQ
jgi:hypothetical protein